MLFPATETMLNHVILDDEDIPADERNNSPESETEEKFVRGVQVVNGDKV